MDDFLDRPANDLFRVFDAEQAGGGHVGKHNLPVAFDKEGVRAKFDQPPVTLLALPQQLLLLLQRRPLPGFPQCAFHRRRQF